MKKYLSSLFLVGMLSIAISANAAVPTVITDLSTTAASNSPAGSDNVGTTMDDFLRAGFAFNKQLFNTATVYSSTVGGTADVITLTPSPALTAYAAGQGVSWIASGTNTTNVTVAVSGLAAKAVTKKGSTALVAGDIPSGALVKAIYDGTRFQIQTIVDTDTGITALTGDATASGSGSQAITFATVNGNVGSFTNSSITVNAKGLITAASNGTAAPSAASQADQETGTSTTTYVSPGRQQYNPASAKAWVVFTGTGTPTIRTSYNVSSITDNGAGDYTVNFTTAFSSADYACTAIGGQNSMAGVSTTAAPTASAFRVFFKADDGGGQDGASIMVACWGDQ